MGELWSHRSRRAVVGRLRLERVDRGHAEPLEMLDVAGGHRQAVHHGRGGDKGVLDRGVRPLVHEARPLPERRGVRGEHAIGASQPQEPLLEFCALSRSFARVFSMPAWISPIEMAEMCNRFAGMSAIRLKTARCGIGWRSATMTSESSRYTACSNYSNRRTGRRGRFLRGGASAWVRAPASSSQSFNDGAALSNRRYFAVEPATTSARQPPYPEPTAPRPARPTPPLRLAPHRQLPPPRRRSNHCHTPSVLFDPWKPGS